MPTHPTEVWHCWTKVREPHGTEEAQEEHIPAETQVAGEVLKETHFLVKPFFSVGLNNPSSPEAAQPGAAPPALARTPHEPEEPGLSLPPIPAAQRQMAGVKSPHAAGMSSQLVPSASHCACWVCTELCTSGAICKLIRDWQLHSSTTARSTEHIFKRRIYTQEPPESRVPIAKEAGGGNCFFPI